jgi:hypothetical protein
MTSENLSVRSGNAPGSLSNTTIVVFKTLLQDLEIESVANIWLSRREVRSDRTKPGRGLVPTCGPKGFSRGYDVIILKTFWLSKVGYKGTSTCAVSWSNAKYARVTPWYI